MGKLKEDLGGGGVVSANGQDWMEMDAGHTPVMMAMMMIIRIRKA